MENLTLHDYQRRAIDFAINNPASFQMLDVGLGKTAIALRTIRAVGNQALVFAPLRVATIVWPAEIQKWTPELTFTVLHGPNKDKRFHYERDIYLISYSSLKWYYEKIIGTTKALRYFMLILDESSMVKNPSTKRFKMLKNIASVVSPHKMLLSATPSPNGLQDLWPQMYILDQGARLENNFSKFRDKYFDYTGPPVYKTTIKPWHDKLIYSQIEDVVFRLDANDYLKLPELIYNRLELEMPPKMRKLYDGLERDFLVKLNDVEITAFNAAAKSMKLRQFLQGATYTMIPEYKEIHLIKVQALAELLEVYSGHPILCAIQFKFEHAMINKALGKTPIIAGGVSAKESASLVRRWNRGDLPLLLCHPASISHGMNLQAGGNIIVWYGLTWSLEQYHQLNGRLHRQGQKNAVVINHLIFPDTIEEAILKVLESKNATQQKLFDYLKTLATV